MPAAQPPRRPLFPPSIVAATIFTLLYLLAAAIGAVASGNTEFIFYIGIMVVMIGAVGLVHWRLRLSAALIWMLTIWGGLHMAGGLVPVPESWPINGEIRVLYSWWILPRDGTAPPGEAGGWIKYDYVVHAYGYGVTAWFVWQALRALVRKYTNQTLRPTFGLMVIVVAASSGFGACNEIAEFTATLIAETNVGGYVNTGMDLVFNTMGAMIAAIVIWMTGRTQPKRSATRRE